MSEAPHEQVLHLVVESSSIAAEDVVVLTLRSPDHSELPQWSPGAHIDLILDDRTHEGLVRQYSLCGDPTDRWRWEIAVLREPDSRGGSTFVHEQLASGSTVRTRGPRNNFALQPAADYVFIAGGIGITPILPMLAEVEATGASWRLLYGGRRRASMAFADELVERYGDRVQLCPEDETGLLDLEGLLSTPADKTLVYCCGPESLLAAAESLCAAWPSDSLHTERFSSRTLDESSMDGVDAVDASFEVDLASSGTTLVVPPDASLLEIVEENGIQVMSSCAEGTCGMCETGVLAGEVDHRDALLSPTERAANDTMYVCVSRAHSDRLVLDL